MLYLDEFRLPDADDEWNYFRHKNAEYAYDRSSISPKNSGIGSCLTR